MYAWQVQKYGHYRDALIWTDIDLPALRPETVKIKVRGAGLSFGLILKIAGKYQIRDALPFVPGLEVAGEVVEAVPDAPFDVGERVMAMTSHGTFCDQTLVPYATTYRLPDAMTWQHAAAFLNAYQTAYMALVPRGNLQPGQTLLVHGAAGGVGLAAVQLGRALGAEVLATAGSADKLAACRAQGAALAINYHEQDFAEAVLTHTHGRGADVILDPVGGDVFDLSRRCLAFDGRLVVVGFASGRIPELSANRILLKNMTVTGFTLHGYRDQRPAVLAAGQAELNRLYSAGRIAPVISHALPMAELPRGIELLETRQSIGKVVAMAPDA